MLTCSKFPGVLSQASSNFKNPLPHCVFRHALASWTALHLIVEAGQVLSREDKHLSPCKKQLLHLVQSGTGVINMQYPSACQFRKVSHPFQSRSPTCKAPFGNTSPGSEPRSRTCTAWSDISTPARNDLGRKTNGSRTATEDLKNE